MNDLGWIVLGSAARATALAALGLLACSALRRRGPAAGALAASTTLAVAVAVSGMAACPWPRWWSPVGEGRGDRARVEAPPRAGSPVEARPAAGKPAKAGPATPRAAEAVGPGDFLRELRRELAGGPAAGAEPGWRWPAWVAVGFLAGLAVAMGRLVLGLRAVGSLRARARPVDDPSIVALVASLSGEMGLGRGVSILESAEVGTPAAVGWRRPAVLLPTAWRGWDGPERRAVLAHELAHVLRGDYLAGIGAQLSLSVHFYHPLVHALAARLRLEQELAADAWGARLSGGRRAYLTTLAHLALRQEPRPAAWPARPFLPTRGTFLRRIEMLRDPRATQHAPLPRRWRAATVGALAAAGLVVAGLRGPAPSPRALAQDAPASKGSTPSKAALGDAQPLDATSVGSDVHLVVDLRVAALLKNPEFKRVADAVPADGPRALHAFASGEIEQVLVLVFDRAEPGAPAMNLPPQSAFVLRASRPTDWADFFPTGTREVQADGVAYFKAGDAPGATCFRRLDDRTLLVGTEPDAQLPPIGPDRPRGRHGWDDAWKALPDGPARLAFDAAWAARKLRAAQGPGRPSLPMSLVGPLLEKARAYGLTLGVADGLTVDARAVAGAEPDAARVADTLRAVLTLARNATPDLRRDAEAGPPQAARPLVDLVDALDAILEGARVEQDQAVVKLHAQAEPAALANAARMLLPAVRASREAARRSVCVNNMKQIGLAMHNYYSANDCFPPAVLYGPDGKTPHSWRVALLPYLDAGDLHAQYKFDEPWDGPSNRKLIDRMPAVYAHPSDPGDPPRPGIAAYFVPTGPDGLFPDRKAGASNPAGGPGQPAPDGKRPAGTQLQEITDGSSNTILVVEARREVPWTKPEDIPFDVAKPLPDLGSFHPGGFNATFADGAVRFLSATIDPTTLRALYTRAGSEPLSINSKP